MSGVSKVRWGRMAPMREPANDPGLDVVMRLHTPRRNTLHVPALALSCTAAVGVAGIAVGAVVPAAAPALWAGLALLAGAGGLAIYQLPRVPGTSTAAAPLALGALGASSDGWYVGRAGGGTAFANPAFRRLAGAETPEALLAQIDATASAALREALAAGRRSEVDVRLVGDLRQVRWLRVNVEPLPAEPGVSVWRLTDVTEQRAATDRLEHLQAAAHALLDESPNGIFAEDDAGHIIYANQAFAGLLGTARDTLVSGAKPIEQYLRIARGERAEGNEAMLARAVLLRADGAEAGALLSRTALRGAAAGMWGARKAAYFGMVHELGDGNPSKTEEIWTEGRFKVLFDNAPIGIAVLDHGGGIVECNKAFQRIIRLNGRPLGDQPVGNFLDQAEREDVNEALRATLAGEDVAMPIEVRIDGEGESVAALFASRFETTDGSGLIVHMIDTTEQKSLELQFAQAQKMQAVGQLAGGIAHDFNNVLTAIIGFCDLLLMRHQAGDHSFADIMQVKQNANRAANLVRQLLAFSRQQTLKPEVLSMTDVLAELFNLLRRLIGEKIELNMSHSRDVSFVKADQGQLEQVIINLAVNARDAMPDGGSLTVRTSNVEQEETLRVGHDTLPRGSYVLIEVIDSGVGITKEHLGKVFEPFYTTKAVGEGTGLGLSTVYGIVKQFDGYVFVDSVPGEGTTFRVYLPQHEPVEQSEAPAAEDAEAASAPRDLTGRGTILLVEDEDAVRMFGARALRNKGYTVLEADCGEMALDLLESGEQSIDLMVTDVVMPGLDGPALAQRIQAKRSDIKVIFISGYAEDAFRSTVDGNTNFLPKPFNLSQLAAKVKEVMDGT